MSLAHQIKQILLQEWDPVEIKNIQQAQDEYDSYLAHITQLLQSQASQSAIALALVQAEVDMGLKANQSRANMVAENLLLIHSL